ncbi:MAG: hypothetical protein ABSF86_09660, partial [Steroidobacteraceae bacterium]
MKTKKRIGRARMRALFHASLSCGLLMLAPAAGGAGEAPQRLVHRFLEIELSSDATFVASVEGDAPANGFLPPVRDLMIRHLRDNVATRIELPCGRVPECWPAALAWAPDGSHLSFALRMPGGHARALYTVAADGSGLTKLLDFNGTIGEMRYGPDGRLAMLATENARKEVGATEAGTPISGDLDAPVTLQRIAVLENDALRWVSPPDLYVYEYDWRPAGGGFIGTAAPGNGDDNWWTAKLYGFSESDSGPQVLYSPANARQQIAKPSVSRDGRSVAFIAGIMSDFGSTGGDVYTLALDGGPAVNLTASLRASATALGWDCNGHLQAQLLKGDQTEFVDLGGGRRPAPLLVLWSGAESVGPRAGVSLACPSGMSAAEHESFMEPPELEAGAIGHWH